MLLEYKKIDKLSNMKSTLVVIPVFNEYKYVADVLHTVQCYSRNILFVDDGSTDGTSDILKNCYNIEIISHKTNLGYGRSLIDAFTYAYESGFKWVITIDCDYQHEPAYIPKFVSEIEKDDIDIVSGSRYLADINSGHAPPPERVAINKKITDILNKHLSLKLTDAFCGFKAYRTAAVTELKLSERGYGLPLQLWILAARANLRIREIAVPLIYYDPKRQFGGILEDPRERFRYYIEIIQKELGCNLDKNIAKLFHPGAKRRYLCKS